MGSELLPAAKLACLRQGGEHLLGWTMCRALQDTTTGLVQSGHAG